MLVDRLGMLRCVYPQCCPRLALQTMKFFHNYPGQKLCFLIGFIPTGSWVCLLAVGADGVLNALGGHSQSSLPMLAIRTFLIYGLIGGVSGQLVGAWLSSFRNRVADNWIWLAFLIPQVAFAVAGIAVDVQNMIECNKVSFPSLVDWLNGFALYAVAALLSSLITIVVVGTCRAVFRGGAFPRSQSS